jgi:hypothetical protein
MMRGRTGWWGLAYLGLAVLAYFPVLAHGRFLCDDFILLARIKNGLGVWNYNGSDFYRPAVGTALSILWRLFGNNPFPYYVLNVLMLVGTGLMVHEAWFTIRKSRREAFGVGLLFILWITHSETVSWISGMTDGLSVFFASIALAMFVRYRRVPTRFGFTVVLLFLWLGLLGKEAIITWMPIMLVLGFALEPKNGALLLKEGAALAGLTAGFICWRTHVIGRLIAGYGRAAHLDLTWSGLSTKFARHLANSFVPFNKWVALWGGSNLAILLTAVVCCGALALCLRKLPRTTPAPKSIHMVWSVMALLGVLRLVEQAVPSDKFQFYGARLTIACVLFVSLAVFNLVRYRDQVRVDNQWAFLAISILVLALHAYTHSRIEDVFLLGVYIWFTIETRPVQDLSESDRRLVRMGLATMAANVLAVLPMLTLPVEVNGEASRFSYGPSLFATFTFASLALLYSKSIPRLERTGAVVIGASGLLLFLNNIPWAQASDLSQQTANAVQSVLPARRVYVLSVPGSVSASYLFRIGLEHLAEVSLGDNKVQIHAGHYQIRTISGDRLDVQRFNQDTFGLEVFNDKKPRRFEDSYLQKADPDMTDGWFNYPKDSKLVDHNVELPQLRLIHLHDFEPDKDHIIVVDGIIARVIQ